MPDFLKEAMSRRLANDQPKAQFDFYVQSAPNTQAKWTDDPTPEWHENTSPLIKDEVV